MNNIVQALSSNQLMVLALPRSKEKDLLFLVSDLAVRGALRVVDGGNLFNVLVLSRMIRRKTSHVEEVLDRIYISRAFTCYQIEAMLHELSANLGPVLVLDLLSTFYDESVDDQQSRHLLAGCIGHLKRLSRILPVFVSISPSPIAGKRPFLMNMLLEAATCIWQWESKPALQLQPTLWE